MVHSGQREGVKDSSTLKERLPLDEGPVQRAPSVPEGHRPVLIVEPEQGGGKKEILKRSNHRFRDPLLEPEIVTATTRAGTVKELGNHLSRISEELDRSIQLANSQVKEFRSMDIFPVPAEKAAQLQKTLLEIEKSNRDLLYIAGKSLVGMMELQLPQMIRDAVKRSYPASGEVRFRLPDIGDDFAIMAHPRHLLDALTIAVSMLITRIDGCGEVSISLHKGRFFAEIQTRAVPRILGSGSMPRQEDVARLNHLVTGIHKGTLGSGVGENDEVLITIGLPLRTFESEIRH